MKIALNHQASTQHHQIAEEVLSFAHNFFSKCLVALIVDSTKPTFRENATSTNLYTRYDALDALETHHDDIACVFLAQLKENFRAITADEVSTKDDPDFLEIIDVDCLELETAVQPLIDKLESGHKSALIQLEQRLKYLSCLMSPDIVNPRGFHPEALLFTFQQAVSHLPLRLSGKQLLCELFEQKISSHLAVFFSKLNALLEKRNILETGVELDAPVTLHTQEEISPTKKQGCSTKDNVLENPIEPNSALTHDEIFAMLSNTPEKGTGSGASSFQRAQILATLSAIQKEDFNQHRVCSFEEIKSRLCRSLYEGGVFNATNVVDRESHVIEFVAGVFEEVQKDEAVIDTAIAPLIARLRNPAIKFALLNFESFKNPKHPARELLNHLATLSSVISSNREPLAVQLNEIIDAILSHFDIDLGVLENSLQTLRGLTETHAEKDRSTALKGQEKTIFKTRSMVAPKIVDDAIKQKIKGKIVAPKALSFVYDVWVSFMKSSFVKYGPSSEEWKDAIYTLRLITEASQNNITLQDFQQLINTPIKFCNVLKSKLADSDIEQTRWQEELDKLQRWLEGKAHRLSSQKAAADHPANSANHVLIEADKPQDDADNSFIQKVTKALKDTHTVQNTASYFDSTYHQNDQANTVKTAFSDKKFSSKTCRRTDKSDSSIEDTAADFIRELDQQDHLHQPLLVPSHIKSGMWFEIYQAKGKAKRRLKLSIIIEETSQILFTNRLGEDELVMDLETFLIDLKKGDTKPINDTNLFDRALNSVISNIQQAQLRDEH